MHKIEVSIQLWLHSNLSLSLSSSVFMLTYLKVFCVWELVRGKETGWGCTLVSEGERQQEKGQERQWEKSKE